MPDFKTNGIPSATLKFELVTLNFSSTYVIVCAVVLLKAYETYVGTKDFGMHCEELKKVQIHGQEFGATTGRPRKCNWINLDKVAYAARVNDITHLVVNKIDILDQVGVYRYIQNSKEHDAGSRLGLIDAIVNALPDNVKVIFSDTPHSI